MKRGIRCGTGPWSADGVHGRLSHRVLGDLHESGEKSDARERACFGRIAPAALEFTLLRRDSGFIGSREEETEARINRTYRNSLRSL